MSAQDNANNIIDDFSFLDGWEEKYKYVIELGQGLAPLDDVYKVDAYKIKGCTSQVWLKLDKNDQNQLIIKGDSDALIVKGLVAILVALFDSTDLSEVNQQTATDLFGQIGLEDQLTPQRAGGLKAMIASIHQQAETLSA